MKPPALIIAGPTASGKSGLALHVARQFGGWVINADSMQVYDVLRVLTARPDAQAEAQVPHRLYGVFQPDQICSAALWRDQAVLVLQEAWDAGALPILVGGTGLYLRAITLGLSPIPAIPDTVREDARAHLKAMGNQAFHAMLSVRDPIMGARLDPGNSQRLSRAWEVLEATGRSLAQWQQEPGEGAAKAHWITLTLDPPRPLLNLACENRFRQMIACGALDEARAIAALNLRAECPATKALGLQELINYLKGGADLEQAVTQGIQATRSYAKRQGTWFRHQMPEATSLKEQYSESINEKIFSFIRQSLLTSQ